MGSLNMNTKALNIFIGAISIPTMVLSFGLGNIVSAIGWFSTLVYAIVYYKYK